LLPVFGVVAAGWQTPDRTKNENFQAALGLELGDSLLGTNASIIGLHRCMAVLPL
jgi:hypothetical protein